MAKLSMYLPPFAGDYSGACSALFGLDCLIIVIDAGCCTRNYVSYDELRWKQHRKTTFSAQLRTLDAVLGDDTRILKQGIEAAQALKPSCVALVGTPVPAIVGMDLEGMAREIETRCGVPAVGLSTTGFETYECGASRAWEVLCRRFAGEGDGAVVRRATDVAFNKGRDSGRLRVNLLGATPHDFMGGEHLAALEACVRARGFDIAWSTARDYSLADVAAAARADVSLVVAWSGLAAARFLRESFGVAFVVGCPLDRARTDAVASALRQACATDRVNDCERRDEGKGSDISRGAPVLIVGDQVAAQTLRSVLRRYLVCAGVVPPIRIASFFSMEPSWLERGDFRIESEVDLIHYAERHPDAFCVGDPLLRRIPGFERMPMFELPHEAVSSTLFVQDAPLPGAGVDAEIDALVAQIKARR